MWSDDVPCACIGVVHLAPLPGAPAAGGSFEACLDVAMGDARAYAAAGFDGLMVENHGDAPFRRDRCDPHVPAFLALCADRLRADLGVPVGINCLRNDAHSALAAAAVSGADLIRVNVLVGAVATDQGIIQGCADTLLRYRRALGAEVEILADVDVKFGTPLYRAPAPEAAVATIERGGASGVIITGSRTGSPPTADEVQAVARAVGARGRVLVGSGTTPENVSEFAPVCDGFIVGSYCKRDGDPSLPVDPDRARRFVAAVRAVEGAGRVGVERDV